MDHQLFLGASLGEIVVAIVTSLVASAVFWLASDYLPKWRAKRKVQPLIDYDLYQVYMELFFYLELPFRPRVDRSSDYQGEIFSGQLTEDDFKTFLSTKCLSEDYRRIDEKAKSLVPIGDILKSKADGIAQIINQLYVFNHYLTAEQILLCRNILDKIYRYSYDMPAFESIGRNTVFHVVDPTLYFMSEVFFELYGLFLQLQKYINRGIDLSSFKSRSIETESRRAKWLFDHKKYRKVIRMAKNSSSSLVKPYYFRALYMNHQKEKAQNALVDFLKETKLRLVSYRSWFKEILEDGTMVATLVKERSQEEFDEMLNYSGEESEYKQAFIQQAQSFRDYYAKKLNRE